MRLPKPRLRAPFAATRAALSGKPIPSYSLFGEILDWMLAPLLFLWPISIIATHHVATRIASQPYDQALAERVRAIARLVHVGASGQPVVSLPPSTRALLGTDEEDTVYYQIARADGEVLVGDPELSDLAKVARLPTGNIEFRDEETHGEDIRVAALRIPLVARSEGDYVVVQVAETRNKRNGLSSRIVSGVLLPQFAIIPVAVVLVWIGLSRGIAPLNRLQARIRRRRPGDLSPIDPASVPEEVRPVVVAFNDMMQRLDDNLHAQQRFIADAAHQMRTPLAGLKMQAELALSETEPAQIRQALDKVYRGAERASRLINQLLALARAEAVSEAAFVFQRIDLEALVREVVADHVPSALAKGLDLGLEDTGWPLEVEGNPVLLRELVSNLVDNAIKYTLPGGSVTVSTRIDPQHPQYAWLGVLDTGVGVPEGERERVFERFYRVLGTQAEGSGLGLPIVREIADLHGASVELKANPSGRGCLVEVSFARALPGEAELLVST